MARVRKSTLSFDAITLEGSLLSSAKFAAVAERKAEDQTDADYSIPKGLTLRDETARYFRIGQALFRELHASSTPSRHKTIEFTDELLRGVFGFSDIQVVRTPKFRDDRIFPVTLEALGGRVPVVVVPPSDGLDHASNSLSQDRRRSAASALQDWLNADEAAVWGVCSNGESLRLLRDNESLTRPAYLEADLRQIFEAEDYAGFSALWLVLHVSRFGRVGALPTDCSLERWRESGSKEGLAARDRLRDGVEAALLALGTGFLTNPANSELSARLREGTWPIDEYFRQLLRLVYKLIFLLAAEDRNLIHIPDSSEDQRKLYSQGYSLGALRDRAIRRTGWDNFHDRWSGLQVTFRALANGQRRLGLPALGGIFASTTTPELDRAVISNRYLMEAIFRLAWLRDKGLLMPVNWRDMETEELGSVYESLLELTPRLTADGREFKFAEGLQTKGNARKTSGSYYTPDSLVQTLLDSALDPVLDQIESASESPIRDLLNVTVIDPACGSGHFLLAAARRIARRIVRLRCGDIHSEQDRLRALRDVVRSCIYGVDRNPMAVELTKVALWIETVEPGKPLGFLDANIRCGDSLLGILSLDALSKGIPDAAYKPLTGDDKIIAKDYSRRNKDEIKGQSRLSFSTHSETTSIAKLAATLRAARLLPEDTVEDISAKEDRYSAARQDPRLENMAQAADLYIAAFLIPKTSETARTGADGLIPTTADVNAAMRAGTVFGPRLGTAIQIARAARVFHWPLEYPDILNGGGFDVVLGNPPWEKIKLQEKEFFSLRIPSIAAEKKKDKRTRMIEALRLEAPNTIERRAFEEFQVAKRNTDGLSQFLRLPTQDSSRFPLTGRGDINTYAVFAEVFTQLASNNGRAGMILPTGIATDDTTKVYFQYLLDANRLIDLIAFYEVRQWFYATDDRRSFCLLTVGTATGPARFIFDIRDIAELSDSRRSVQLLPKDIAAMNPNTRTAPILRSQYDADLTKAIYGRVSCLVLEGADFGNPWGVSFSRVFDMSNDANLFQSQANDAVSFRVSQNELKEFLPLLEAKLIQQFDHRWGSYTHGEVYDVPLSSKQDPSFEITPQYWVSKAEATNRLRSSNWHRDWILVFRGITSAATERSIVTAFTGSLAAGNSCPVILVGDEIEPQRLCALAANLNSLVLDFVARQKIGGLNLNFFIIEQLPILPPKAYSTADLDFIASRVLKLNFTSHSMGAFSRDTGYNGPPFDWDEDLRARVRAELDAWYAHSYGLSRDELRYILDPADIMGADYPSETFRVLKNNEERKYGEYRTRRLVLDAWDRMERGELHCPQPYLAPPLSAARSMTILQPNISDQNPLLGAGPLFEGIESTSVEHPPFADPSTLPNDVWAMPNYNSISVQLQLAAILKQLSGPTSAARVRLAALYALNPQLITSRLSGTDLKTWQRLIGSSARASGAANVIQFIPRGNIEWRDAYTQLRGMHALLEDATNDTWAPGSIVQEFLTEGWADGRAGFVMKAMEGMEIETSITELPVDLQTWVRAHAA